MEKGATNGFIISDNKLLSSNSDVVRLMKLQHSDDEVFPSKIWMDVHRPVDAGGGGGGGGGWPAGISSGGANEAVVGHVHCHDDASSSGVGGENYARSGSTNSQPFDIFASSCSTKSLGGAMAAYPFTSAQWKELERQALIYKYMISSVPVPPHLLFPLSRHFPASPSLVYNVGYTKNGDLEPGRCKRTDGKKWRCSREVAAGQKYCERHLHRGRPRSRKPVEVLTSAAADNNHHKKTRIQNHLHLPISTTTTTATTHAKFDPTISTTPSSYKGFNRDLSLMAVGNVGFPNDGSSSIYSSTPIFHQDYYMEDQLKLNTLSYSNMEFGAPTGYIDAWSTNNNLNNNNNESNGYSLSWMNNGDFSPSLDLSIAMAAGNLIDSEMRNIQMGANDVDENTTIAKDSNMGMLSPVFFGSGGPLAEALQVASPRDSMSTPATTVSSPSGVLHSNRTLFSHSDSSVCNSPTFAVPTSEVAFHRLN